MGGNFIALRFETWGFIIVLGRFDVGMTRDSCNSCKCFSSLSTVRDVVRITRPDEVGCRTLGLRAAASKLAGLLGVDDEWVVWEMWLMY